MSNTTVVQNTVTGRFEWGVFDTKKNLVEQGVADSADQAFRDVRYALRRNQNRVYL